MRLCLPLALLASHLLLVGGLDNGLALTPPMGWLSWARFFCETDCVKHPLGCISEQLYMDMADRLAADGFKDAGYELVNIDDCWMAAERDAQGRLQPDPARFPSGIKALATYMHSKGLKLGIYEDYGTKTCAGYPGSLDHLEIDAQTFASWNVDMLKLDGCNVDVKLMDAGYPEMTGHLNATGRPMLYSCSWPAYQVSESITPNYTRIGQYCNLWRNFDDIESTWSSISSIINYYDHHQDELIPAAGPGRWNDPDMLVIGNPGVTVDQAKAQFAIWSIWAAPLLMSNDLRFLAPAFKEILLNKEIIAINQDPMGVMGRLIVNTTDVGVYRKPVMPLKGKQDSSYALVFFNRNLIQKASVMVVMAKLGLSNPSGYHVRDLYTGQDYGTLLPDDTFSCTVNPTGVVMVKATIAVAA